MRLGFLMGEWIMLICHVGRTSGRTYQTAVEVVEHDRQTHEYIVCSGTGPKADWYRNITARPPVWVQVANRRWRPDLRFLSQEEAAQRFKRYEAQHRRIAKVLLNAMGNSYDGTDQGRFDMMVHMPMVAISDSSRRQRNSNVRHDREVSAV
jgi:deazaflavin-dependent oxidoreductase (nitroreductase family)